MLLRDINVNTEMNSNVVFFICSILMLFTFATLNVNGLRNTAKRKSVFNFLREKNQHNFFIRNTQRYGN